MAYKTLTLGRLPRVMVHTLAMSDDDRQAIKDTIREVRARGGYGSPNCPDFAADSSLAEHFSRVLHMSKSERERFVTLFARALDELLAQDFFGTEGQSDPRGDHRDND